MTNRIRAVIFDLYGTLLQVGPPPPDADALWQKLFHETFQSATKLSRLEFSVATNQAIAKRHAEARARGIATPEVSWPAIVAEVLPEFQRLTPAAQEEFLFRHIQTGRTTRLINGAADVLRSLRGRCIKGVASNAQAYSIRELEAALQPEALELDLFAEELCFWSYHFGFSKPDPHVFQILLTRLEARGISAGETLMVGDRLDNDIGPARAQGFRAWLLTAADAEGTDIGSWGQLGRFLSRSI